MTSRRFSRNTWEVHVGRGGGGWLLCRQDISFTHFEMFLQIMFSFLKTNSFSQTVLFSTTNLFSKSRTNHHNRRTKSWHRLSWVKICHTSAHPIFLTRCFANQAPFELHIGHDNGSHPQTRPKGATTPTPRRLAHAHAHKARQHPRPQGSPTPTPTRLAHAHAHKARQHPRFTPTPTDDADAAASRGASLR